MTTKESTRATDARHPFAVLLAQYRARKPGLTQTRLAQLAGYDQAIIVRMTQGKKDLTGPSGRERIVRLIETLADQGALTTLEEANALLSTANLPPLFERQPNEARLLARLAQATGHHVRRTNLPAAISMFIGRVQEIAEVRGLLSGTRLLTLTGAGGAGKTRLAQQVAADVLIAYSDGVWYVELAVLVDPARIDDVVAQVFGLAASERPVFDQLADYLRDRHALLVLDNCEHLIEAAADFTLGLLRACPRLVILATSREALNVEGETTWRVPPLQPNEAAQLFVMRANAARPDLAVNVGDETVLHICRRLDGMPLAIELAAARLNGMSVGNLSQGLDDRFNLLTGGRRGALPRHQTLRALIDWSHDLLSPPERILFRRLSVFVGGWSADAAAQVCADADNTTTTQSPDHSLLASNLLPLASDLLPLLLDLVRKSLVVVEQLPDGETRYRCLETIREYAHEKLTLSGEMDMLQRWHAQVFYELAQASIRPIRPRTQVEGFARLENDYPNLRAALQWSFGPRGDRVLGCQLVAALYEFWLFARQHYADAQKWVTTALQALNDTLPPALQGSIWLAADQFLHIATHAALQDCQSALAYFEAAGHQKGSLWAKIHLSRAYYYLHERATALTLSEECVVEARVVGDDNLLTLSLEFLGECLRFSHSGFTERAQAAYAEALAVARANGDLHYIVFHLVNYGCRAAQERLDFELSTRYAMEGLELARRINDPLSELSARCIIAENTRYLGDASRAVTLLEECLAYAGECLPECDTVGTLIDLAKALNAVGDVTRSWALLKEALRIHLRAWPDKALYETYDAMSAVASARGDFVGAAYLRGIADAGLKARGHYRPNHSQWESSPYIARAHEALGDTAYEAAYAAGFAISLEQATAYALSTSSTSIM